MSEKNPFSGAGFSRDSLTADETASHREAHRELASVWATVTGIDQMAKGAARLGRVIAAAAIIGGAIAFGVKQGWFS